MYCSDVNLTLVLKIFRERLQASQIIIFIKKPMPHGCVMTLNPILKKHTIYKIEKLIIYKITASLNQI